MTTITTFIVLITVLFSYKGFKDYTFFNKYKFDVNAISHGDNVRFVSSALLHANWEHLIFNMLSLYFFAPVVSSYLGDYNLFFMYIAAALLGNLLTYFLYKTKPYYTAVGASGAVTGIIFASILLEPNSTIFVFFIPMPSLVFGFLYLGYSIYAMKKNNDNIGHSAHIGGAIAGLLYTISQTPDYSNKTLIILAIPIAILAYMIYSKKI